MFFVVYEDGEQANEAEIGDWDHVPGDRRLQSAGILVPVWGDKAPRFLPVGFKNKARYYVAHIRAAPLGGMPKWLGYVIIGVDAAGAFERITADHRGIVFDSGPDIAALNIREEAFRNGKI